MGNQLVCSVRARFVDHGHLLLAWQGGEAHLFGDLGDDAKRGDRGHELYQGNSHSKKPKSLYDGCQ